MYTVILQGRGKMKTFWLLEVLDTQQTCHCMASTKTNASLTRSRANSWNSINPSRRRHAYLADPPANQRCATFMTCQGHQTKGHSPLHNLLCPQAAVTNARNEGTDVWKSKKCFSDNWLCGRHVLLAKSLFGGIFKHPSSRCITDITRILWRPVTFTDP